MNEMTIKKTYQWAIVGAGPAGIAVVGKLLDSGKNKSQSTMTERVLSPSNRACKKID